MTPRTTRLLVFTCLLCAATTATLRATRLASGIGEDTFVARKLAWREAFEMVFAGDSKMEAAISPADVAAELAGRRVANFAFRGAGWEEKYLAAVGRVLNTGSRSRSVVLGVTPRAFTSRATSYNAFLNRPQRPPFEQWAHRVLGDVLGWFEPVDIGLLLNAGPQHRRSFIFHENGWRACRSYPLRPTESLAWYRLELSGQRITLEAVRALETAVRSWSTSGTRVYALRVPATREMEAMEDRLTEYDERSMIARLTKAGARWMHFDADSYRTYDGTHLVEAEAIRFSRHVARQIAAMEKDATR